MKKLLLVAGVIFSAYAMDNSQEINGPIRTETRAKQWQSYDSFGQPQEHAKQVRIQQEHAKQVRIQREWDRARDRAQRMGCSPDYCCWCMSLTVFGLGMGISHYFSSAHQE